MRVLAFVLRGQAETYLLGTFIVELETAWMLFLVWCCASIAGRGFHFLVALAILCGMAFVGISVLNVLLLYEKVFLCGQMSAKWKVSPLLVACAICRYDLLKHDFSEWDTAAFEVWYLEAMCPLPYRQRLEIA